MDGATIRIPSTLSGRIIGKETQANNKPADTPGRSWLLLKELSKELGTDGSVDVDAARNLLTNPDSKYKVAGKRHWRTIVERGEGVYWTVRSGRLWLHGTARVCKSLGIDKLQGRSVEIPIEKLLGPIHKVRSTFYAGDVGGRVEPKPMSRRVIEKRIGVSPRRQKRYERLARIKVKKQTAVLGDYSDYLLNRARYHFGKSAYNSHGRVCFQLPNVYNAPGWVVQLPRAKSKSVSFAIKRLNNAGAGSVAKLADKLYHDTEQAAVTSFLKNDALLTYWQVSKKKWRAFYFCPSAELG